MAQRATLKLYKKVIPAGAQIGPLALPGTLFCVKESDGVFQVAFDDSDYSDVEVGIQFRDGEGFEQFRRVYLRNTSAADISVEFWIGNGRQVIDSRLNTLVDRTVSVSAGTKDSYTKGTTVAGVGAFTGTNVDGKKRKSIYVWNNEAGGGATLVITCANGVTGFRLAPQTGIRIDTGGSVSVSTGAADVMEVFEL